MWGNQLSRGPTQRLPRFISLSYGSLGRGDGSNLSGWPVQLRVYTVVNSESAAGSPVQPRVYAVAAGNAASPLHTSSSRSVERWPRLPLGGRSSCGSTQWPTSLRERQLAGSPVQTAGLRGGGPFASSHPSSLVIRVVRSGDGLDSPGRSVQLQDAVGHPGSSSSDRRPAVGLRDGGLSEWPVHRELSGATRDLRGPAQLRDAGCHPGMSGLQSSHLPTRWQSLRVAGFTAGYAGPLGVVGWPARPLAAGMTRVWQVGELTLPGNGAQGGSPRAGLTGRAQQVLTSPSWTSSIRRAGSAAGLQLCRQACVLTPWAQAGGAAMVAGSSTPTAAASGPRGGELSPPATGPDSVGSARNLSGPRRPPRQLQPPHCLKASHT